jgi:hypothetical protein
MTGSMRRSRALPVVVVGVLAALGFAASAAAGDLARVPEVTGETLVGAGSLFEEVSEVSAQVVVPAEALWTFGEPEITVTSTLPATTEIDVQLRGHQAEIDRCAGPVLSDYGAYGKVIGEHNHCGGAYVLEFEVGDAVRLTGYAAGDYLVVFLKDVPKKNTPVSVLSGADLFLQTCHFTGGRMRLVALEPLAAA